MVECLRVDVVTLFPEAFEGFLRASFVERAITAGKLTVAFRSPREFGLGKHHNVDDTPYGGGSGMVMRVDVLAECMDAIERDAPLSPPRHRVLLTPQGAPLNQARVQSLSERGSLMLICGRYEGFDERVRTLVNEEISLGDFVMTGGEVAAMAVIDACIRLVPGVLGNEHSATEESHSPHNHGLLEYPQYTRPADFRGLEVPAILAGGNHKEIARYRLEESEKRTKERRPDIYERYLRERKS